MEENLLQCPEIINPFNLDSRSSNDSSFVKDLSLESFLRSVPFSYDARCLAKNALIELDSNDETVRYRQNALEELIKTPQLKENVEKIVKPLFSIREDIGHGRDFSLARGLDFLRKYRDFMQNFPDLESAQSEAIISVNDYLKSVRNSDEFSGLCNFINKIENLVEVEFRVSLDEHCLPFEMSALKLTEKKEKSKKSIFENLFGTKVTPEKDLKDSYGHVDALGGLIRNYLTKKFICVVYEFISQMREVTSLYAPLDFYRGFADYFIKLKKKGFDISRPTLLPQEERKMVVKNARNPLLEEARINGYKIVPNNIEYDKENNVFVITGPNNGGKTTYVKTVGLIQLMAQSGLFVPAESSEVSFTDGIYTHFVAPDDITKGEGRYRNELKRMKEIFARATPYSLIILDEPCGGTSYEEGQKQSLIFLDGFHKLGSATYFTTHMHPLTKEVDNGRYKAGKNLQVECIDDGEKIKYTYKVIPGSSGKSYGEEIAREIGLRSENIINIISKKADEEGYTELLR